jgi:hypothetical protein
VHESWQLAAGKDLVMTPERAEQYVLAMEFLLDVVSPEGYGHAMPAEVIRRASRILKLIPKEVEHPAPAESPPP